ncbi:MAG: tyrosine--tRNA ligase [Candidatus Eisenbacteria sp.]|nr:tyrosine--tRNA ligase [Candidatus Eisenbacteria bacterium]
MPPLNEQMDLIRRGTAEIISEEELEQKVARSIREKKPLTVKEGFDPTAPDIHIGHTVSLRKMRHFQDLGHDVVFLIGDFTGMIGDPTGKSETRKRLSREEVEQNAKTYEEQIFKILDRDRTTIDFNSRWLSSMTLASVAKLAAASTVARMLERDDFAGRFREKRPISILEFLYPLMQGYDSVALEADIELGGTDQKFNLLVGRDIQRAYGQEPQVVITLPLLVGLDGTEKMSKSLGNYVGVTDPPNEMFGKLMSIADSLMMNYFEILTDVPGKQLDRIRRDLEEGAGNPREVKARLARIITAQYYGEEATELASDEFDRVFRDRGLPEDMEQVALETEGETIWIVKLVVRAGLAKSNGEARRLVEQGGVSLDGERVDDAQAEISVRPGLSLVLRVGKRRFRNVQFVGG